jgi:hypothetical protein
MALLDLHYIWAFGHAVTVACSCTPFVWFSKGSELIISIHHFPNGLVPVYSIDDLQALIYWYTPLVLYCMLQGVWYS